MRIGLERAGVLPLVGIADHRGQRHQEDLVLGVLLRVGVLHRVAAATELEVYTTLELRGVGWLEELVAQRGLVEGATHWGQGLVLCREAGTETRGTVARPAAKLVDSLDLEILIGAPCTGYPVVGLPARLR